MAQILYRKFKWILCNDVSISFCTINANGLKWVKRPLSGLTQFLTIENPLKMMKNAFHFILKVLFVLEIFIFCTDFLIM